MRDWNIDSEELELNYTSSLGVDRYNMTDTTLGHNGGNYKCSK